MKNKQNKGNTMTPTEDKKHIFTGCFDRETRARLRAKRRSLGLSYNGIANFIGVEWSTYRKWELGPTAKCGAAHIGTLEAFMLGSYDNILSNFRQSRKEDKNDTTRLINSLRLVSSLVSDAPLLKQDFDSRLNSILDEAVCALISV